MNDGQPVEIYAKALRTQLLLRSRAPVPCCGLHGIMRSRGLLLRLWIVLLRPAVCRIAGLRIMAWLGLGACQLLLGWLRCLQARPSYQFPGRQGVFGHRWRRWLLSMDDRRYRQRQTSHKNRFSIHNILLKRRNVAAVYA
jgi:hypothetical protein